MSFHNQTTQKSRRRRQCKGSFGIIEAGEQYVRFTGVNDGDFYSVPMKVAVAEIYDRLNQETWKRERECLYFNELIDAVFEAKNVADMEALVAANPLLTPRLEEVRARELGQVINATHY